MSEHDSAPPPPDADNDMMSHVVRRGIPLLVLVLAVAAAWYYWGRSSDAPTHEAAAAPQGPVEVTVVTVQPEQVPVHPRFLGQTEGSQVVEIRARVAGYLQERNYKEGDRVEKGQKLFQIDPRPFEVELAQAKARLASSQATQMRAEQQLRRFQELVSRNAAPASELEEWQMQVGVAAADVELQKAMIASAELQLGYTSIESPVTGVVGQALKDVGSYVNEGTDGLLAVVQQVDPIYVRYSVTEQEMLRWQRQVAENKLHMPELNQMQLEITLSDGSVYEHKGRINFIDVEVSRTTGTSVVRGTVPNPDNRLKPGQFIYASPLGIERINVLRVPQKAVLQSPTGASVYVVNEKNVVESRPVKLGEWSGTEHWIIENGLNPGDRVVTDRLVMVRPGMPVAPTPATANANPATRPAPSTESANAGEGR